MNHIIRIENVLIAQIDASIREIADQVCKGKNFREKMEVEAHLYDSLSQVIPEKARLAKIFAAGTRDKVTSDEKAKTPKSERRHRKQLLPVE